MNSIFSVIECISLAQNSCPGHTPPSRHQRKIAGANRGPGHNFWGQSKTLIESTSFNLSFTLLARLDIKITYFCSTYFECPYQNFANLKPVQVSLKLIFFVATSRTQLLSGISVQQFRRYWCAHFGFWACSVFYCLHGHLSLGGHPLIYWPRLLLLNFNDPL